MIVKKDKVVFEDHEEYKKFQRKANHENNYSGVTNRPWINEDLQSFIEYVTNKKSKILSVGTRDFYDLRFLRQHGYYNLVGCDIDERSESLAKEFNIRLVVCDIHNHKFGEKFDAVYSRHVLEHCYDVDLAIKNIVNHVSNDGYVMLVVPLEIYVDPSKGRGHCCFWKTPGEFSEFCNKYLHEIKCVEDTVSRKKPQVMYLGQKSF